MSVACLFVCFLFVCLFVLICFVSPAITRVRGAEPRTFPRVGRRCLPPHTHTHTHPAASRAPRVRSRQRRRARGAGSREKGLKRMGSEVRRARHVRRFVSARSPHRCRPARSLAAEILGNNSELRHDHCGIQGRFNVQTRAKTSRFTGMGGPRVCLWLHLALKCEVFVRAARGSWL